MTSAFQQWKAKVLSREVIVIWVAASVLAVAAGPFGTFHAFSFWLRLIYWPATFGAALALATALRLALHEGLKVRRFLVQAPLLAAALALLLGPPLNAITEGLAASSGAVLPGLGPMMAFILAVSIGISTIRHVVTSHRAPARLVRDPATPRLLRRLPEDIRAPILRLSVRDHYVDVVTEAGSASLLLRLGDAIDETDGVPGAQVHRSHWVAAAAVAGVETTAGRLELRLSDGTRVPVTKTFQAQSQAMLTRIGQGGVPTA